MKAIYNGSYSPANGLIGTVELTRGETQKRHPDSYAFVPDSPPEGVEILTSDKVMRVLAQKSELTFIGKADQQGAVTTA